MKTLFTLLVTVVSFTAFNQTKEDIFRKTDYPYTYLGIDYSHAKFIGDFTQFAEFGEVGYSYIRDEYFPRWNSVVIREPDKYSWEDALRKNSVEYDLSTISEVNEKTPIEDMETFSSTIEQFSAEKIQSYIKNYKFNIKEGVGILLVCEYLDKNRERGCFHFVAINMKKKKVILHKRFVKAAKGFGLRNYWIRPVFEVFDEITKFQYARWKNSLKKK